MLLLSGCMTMDGFFFNGSALDAYALGGDVIPADNVEEVTFPTADGATLYGVWAHQPIPDVPVFLYFHGNKDHIDHYWDKVEIYWSLGLEVFIFDYRGFGRSEGDPTWDTLLADGAAAADHASGATGLALGDITFHGLSLGGTCAVNIAAERTPKVLITEDMFASAEHLINDGSGLDLPDGWFVEDEWDNVAAAARVDAPYMIMHGTADDYIRPANAEDVYGAANDPKLLWMVEGANHAETPETDPDGYAEHILCWMAQDCADG